MLLDKHFFFLPWGRGVDKTKSGKTWNRLINFRGGRQAPNWRVHYAHGH
jgi:hypothetical protein